MIHEWYCAYRREAKIGLKKWSHCVIQTMCASILALAMSVIFYVWTRRLPTTDKSTDTAYRIATLVCILAWGHIESTSEPSQTYSKTYPICTSAKTELNENSWNQRNSLNSTRRQRQMEVFVGFRIFLKGVLLFRNKQTTRKKLSYNEVRTTLYYNSLLFKDLGIRYTFLYHVM